MFRLAFAMLCALVGFGCGGTAKPPTYQLTQAKAAVRAAEEVDAQNTPQAALYLKMARDQIKEAESLIGGEDTARARQVLKRAEADAELAIALAKEARQRSQAEAALDKVQKLRKETD